MPGASYNHCCHFVSVKIMGRCVNSTLKNWDILYVIYPHLLQTGTLWIRCSTFAGISPRKKETTKFRNKSTNDRMNNGFWIIAHVLNGNEDTFVHINDVTYVRMAASDPWIFTWSPAPIDGANDGPGWPLCPRDLTSSPNAPPYTITAPRTPQNINA